MQRTVLGISTSPRGGGNSDLLVQEALRGAESVGGRAEYVALRQLRRKRGHSDFPIRVCDSARANFGP